MITTATLAELSLAALCETSGVNDAGCQVKQLSYSQSLTVFLKRRGSVMDVTRDGSMTDTQTHTHCKCDTWQHAATLSHSASSAAKTRNPNSTHTVCLVRGGKLYCCLCWCSNYHVHAPVFQPILEDQVCRRRASYHPCMSVISVIIAPVISCADMLIVGLKMDGWMDGATTKQ